MPHRVIICSSPSRVDLNETITAGQAITFQNINTDLLVTLAKYKSTTASKQEWARQCFRSKGTTASLETKAVERSSQARWADCVRDFTAKKIGKNDVSSSKKEHRRLHTSRCHAKSSYEAHHSQYLTCSFKDLSSRSRKTNDAQLESHPQQSCNCASPHKTLALFHKDGHN